MKHWTLLALVAAVCVCSLPAAAGTIFNDFGAGNSYNCCTGWTVSGPSSPPGQFISANQFVAGGGGGTVSQIDLGIGLVVGNGTGTASLYTVSSGLPGTLLGSWNYTAQQAFGGCCAISTINIAGGPTLSNGVSYYLVITGDSSNWNAWNLNDQGATGIDLFSNDGHNWNNNGVQSLGAFRILSGQGGVPEPGTFVMLGSGVLAAAGAFRRKLNL